MFKGAAPVEDEGSEWAAFPSPAKVEGEAQETGDDDNWAAFGAETAQDGDGGLYDDCDLKNRGLFGNSGGGGARFLVGFEP